MRTGTGQQQKQQQRRRSHRRARGSALIEFAFALALMVPIVAGGWQFYEAYLRMEEIQQAAIRGAQFASNLPYESESEVPPSDFRRAVENVILYRNPNGGGRSVVPGLRRDMLRLSMRFEAGRPAELAVSVDGYRLPLFAGGGITLRGRRPLASYPFRGHWAAATAAADSASQ